MNRVRKGMEEIVKNIAAFITTLDDASVKELVSKLANTERIFCYGAGRSGYVAKSFAMRLMHLGLNSYVIGETTTPAVQSGDVLIVISGSGETASTVLSAEAASNIGAEVIALTSNKNSRLGKSANFTFEIGVIKNKLEKIRLGKNRNLHDYLTRRITGGYDSAAPLGTLFEDTCQVFLDGVVYALMKEKGIKEHVMKQKHSNIE